jgi:hypothetical protein
MLMTKSKIEAPPINQYVIDIGDGAKVIEDKKTKSRVFNAPFEFKDGTRGVIIIIRVKDEKWVPADDITNLIINFNGIN